MVGDALVDSKKREDFSMKSRFRIFHESSPAVETVLVIPSSPPNPSLRALREP
mgnify:FL=1